MADLCRDKKKHEADHQKTTISFCSHFHLIPVFGRRHGDRIFVRGPIFRSEAPMPSIYLTCNGGEKSNSGGIFVPGIKGRDGSNRRYGTATQCAPGRTRSAYPSRAGGTPFCFLPQARSIAMAARILSMNDPVFHIKIGGTGFYMSPRSLSLTGFPEHGADFHRSL